ncbi:MAG TPA: hypothetical protein VL098_08470 [Flavipsychrobacter sp.]|nr:hypothetical protein [Flavipsychrobacter sp.]
MSQHTIVTDERLEEAYTIMAAIIRDHGDKYLPVFKRLHEERLQRKEKNDLKAIALQVAEKISIFGL